MTFPEFFFWQIGTYIEPTKTPPWLMLSGKIFKISASMYLKNAFPGSVCC